MQRVLDAVVVGGGISGLATAYQLLSAEPTLSIRVLESGDRLGGNIRTIIRDECVIDLGPDSIVSFPPDALDLCEQIGLTDELISPAPVSRRVFVAHGHKVHQMPDGLAMGIPAAPFVFAKTQLISWPAKFRALLDFVLPPQPTEDRSLGEIIEYRLGKEIKETLVEPLLGGLFGADLDHLDAHVVMPMLMQNQGSLYKTLKNSDKQVTVSAPAKGMSELVEFIAKKVSLTHIQTSSRVEMIRKKKDLWDITVHGGQSLSAKNVILALPPPQIADIVELDLPDLARDLREIKMKSVATVVLGFDSNDIDELDGGRLLSSALEKTAFLGVSFLSRKWPSRIRPHRSVLRVEIGGNRSADLMNEPDGEIVGVLLDELRRYLRVGQPRWWVIERYKYASPVPDVGHEKRVQAIRTNAEQYSGLHLAGTTMGGAGIAGCAWGAVQTSKRVVESLRAMSN